MGGAAFRGRGMCKARHPVGIHGTVVALASAMDALVAREQPATRQTPGGPDELLRLRLAVEASGEIIFMTDARGAISYVNPEFVRVYGYQPSEAIGRTPRMLKSGAMATDAYAPFWQQLLAKKLVRREFTNRAKSGALVHVDSSANPIFNGSELVGFLAVQRDITERKATEAALRDSEHRYRTLADAAQDSIFIVGRNGEIEYANIASTERFGVPSEEAIGKRLHDVFPAETAGEMWRELSTVFATRSRHYVECRFETLKGDLWLGTWLVPMSDRTAEPHAVMGVARDITEQKRLEKQFLQSQKMEAIGQLTGGIAHDFNNVLTAILGYSELILGRADVEAAIASDVEEVKKAGERAARLTRQLLTFSRKQVTTPQVLDLNEVVRELQKMLCRVINEDIDLEILTEPRLDRVKADAGQIDQLILNLVVNARDAMPRGGSLRVATGNVQLDAEFARQHEGAVPGRYVSLTVQDTGCGMTPEVLAHVFEPFFTTKPAGQGTGLGLATVYGIVKQSGGYISIASEPGKGTNVTAYLPRVDEVAVSNVVQPRRAKTLAGKETILLVEDESGLRTLMQRTLQQYGYVVLNAANVTEALEIAESRRTPIDLLLTDVVMPGLSGPELAQRVVLFHPAIKLFFVSGFAHVAVSGSRHRPATLLPKPFTPLTLAARVRECLDAREGPARAAADA
jgi:two-component system cell cycle sensor histidine kinase/response regulator CckA